MSEDCLFLNIWTPGAAISGDNNEVLPVMVYIHGGSFVLGSGQFDGGRFINLTDGQVSLISSRGDQGCTFGLTTFLARLDR